MQTKLYNVYTNPPRSSRGIFYLCLAWFTLYGPAFFAQPRLEVQDRVKNLGRVPKGEVVTIAYEVKNAGDQPLTIDSAEVGCDCTTASLPRAPLAPGTTATVVVSFETKSAYGRQDRNVKLFSSDPRGAATLRFKANVQKTRGAPGKSKKNSAPRT